jgi:hypothetical protein
MRRVGVQGAAMSVITDDRLQDALAVGHEKPERTGRQLMEILDCTKDELVEILKPKLDAGEIGYRKHGDGVATFHVKRLPWGDRICPDCGTSYSGDYCNSNWHNQTAEEQKAAKTPTARTRGRTRGRRDKKESRLAPLGPYAPVPRAILKDPNLSLGAKGLAAVLFDRLNLGPWNIDLHVDAN